MAVFNSETKRFTCECGCGEEVPPWNSFKPGHNLRVNNPCKDPEVREKISRTVSALYDDPTYYNKVVEQLREACETRWASPGSHERASETTSRVVKETWASYTLEEKLDRLSKGLHSPESQRASQETCRRGFSSYEEELFGYIEEDYPGKFLWNKGKYKNIGGFFPDIYSEEYRLVIECFGEPWHSFEPYAEELKIEHYEKYGFKCLVIWAERIIDIICQLSEIRDWINEQIRSVSEAKSISC